MISKKNLWFLTLFSIILVMSIYYVVMPEDTTLVSNIDTSSTDATVTINESEAITALRVSRDEVLQKSLDEIESILNSDEATLEEKNDAYEALQTLNNNKGKEETLESLIKKSFNYENYVEIDGTNIKVVIDSSSHSYELANKIITTLQNEFDSNMYITVTFKA